MSSNDEEYDMHTHRGKKRRIARACDVCRRRKSDGSQMDGEPCSTCIDAKLECTYLETTTKVRSSSPKRLRSHHRSNYIESLEARLERSEAQVRQLRAELASAHFSTSSSAPVAPHDCEASARTPAMDATTASLHVLRTVVRSLSVPPPPPHGDDLVHLELTRKFGRLAVGTRDIRFLGKSSSVVLIKAAINLKADDDGGVRPWGSRRLQYWTYKPWEFTKLRTHNYTFPPLPLMLELAELYFAHVNKYLPLLHRPTFERNVREGLYLRNDSFAATVLLVCAVASRWSADPRMGAPGGIGVDPHADANAHHPPAAANGLSCGWAWFNQVPLVGDHMFGQATLYDLQYYCLAVQFLEGSSAPQACWTLVGVGLRLAQQDMGAHRRSAHVEELSVEHEQMKRAFWVLVYLDRIISSGMGRPCAMQYDDFDIDMPIECDDEYWEHPTRPFQQPPGIPSRVSFFNTMISLNNMLAFSLKILYPLNKVRTVLSITDAWEENVVAELDSALNSWHDKVPEHLRWDPARADPVFFDQSVALQCGYYHLQILVHRPFIPMMRKSAPTALPSLAVCTSAARACANVVNVQQQRKGRVPVVFSLHAVFTSAIVLLLNVWSGRRTGLVPDPTREIANVQKCMEVVRLCEDRWQHAGLLWDILWELASVGQMPLQNNSAAGPDVERHQASSSTVQPLAPVPHYPLRHFAMPEDTAHNLQSARGPRPSFDRPAGEKEWRAPYAPPAGAFSGGVDMPGAFGHAPMEPSAFAPPPPAPNQTWVDPAPEPFADMNGDPTVASAELGDMMNLIDSDTIAMWASAPMGLEIDVWGNYFNNFSEITQGAQL
ncbi:fungal-specific transcription factor domain-containing protein [Mycena pura]|uniref:Fungal-specific transcription factor domain-containing protein n=1 Tax=Mycena pura TaxID=153505 RepID=A0AAD6YA34_9AGAR|nr:fungal-specific transcription factor domain-containing protein [Mycena pura]